ncbi:MAG TPA: MFS transporter [Candidatus Sulfotelmatobacter sp.]|nr:MFS transporter [Candidatus Sulfotelmatobacter sp.]
MQPTKRFHYAWIVIGVTFFALMAGMGVRSNFGVYIKPLEAEFHTTREPISRINFLSLLLFALVQPVIGMVLDRYGPRVVLAGSMLLAGLGTVGLAYAPSLFWVGVLYAIVGGIASGGAAVTAGTSVATRWFVKSRGLAIGIAGAGSSTGQLIFFPLATWLLLKTDWRFSYLLQGILMAAVAFPLVAWLARSDPRDLGIAPYGADEVPVGSAGTVAPLGAARERRVGLAEAARSRDFWLLAMGFFVCGYTSTGLIQFHFIPYAMDHGFHAMEAANALGLMGALNIVGTMLSGRLCDRVGNRIPLSAVYFLRALAILFLLLVRDGVMLTVWAMTFGLTYIASVPPTSGLTADLFGRLSVGKLFGWIFLSHQVGAALGSWIGGYLYDRTGNYVGAFLSAAALAFVASALSYAIRESPRAVPVPAAAVGS